MHNQFVVYKSNRLGRTWINFILGEVIVHDKKWCSYLAEDICPLPLAVDGRGLDDELDLGQVAAPSAAVGVPVHAVAVR